jgi:hypothetical protein
VTAASTEFTDWVDLVLKVLALGVIAVGLFQLTEARRKRRVDMYWELLDRYLSPDGRQARAVILEVQEALGIPARALIGHDVDDSESAAAVAAWTSDYNDRFHDTKDPCRKHVHPAVLYRLRYLDQAGLLLKKRLVDRDLLLGLISAGVEIDRAVLVVTLTAVREHEGFRVYPYVGPLIGEVDQYVRRLGLPTQSPAETENASHESQAASGPPPD